jgi:hypothetical protein
MNKQNITSLTLWVEKIIIMNTFLTNSIFFLSALATGSGVGFLFGTLQNAAFRRNKKLNKTGKLKSELNLMSGSLSRVATLLILLVLLQLILPFLFEGNTQWIVSAGVVLGYGWTLLKQLNNRTSNKA